jgi:hypothetical protein
MELVVSKMKKEEALGAAVFSLKILRKNICSWYVTGDVGAV